MSNTANKWSLYLIIGVPILGILLTTAYYFYITGSGLSVGTHNKGILLTPPRDIKALAVSQNGAPYQWDIRNGKWTFLVIGKGACEKACQDQLYLTRQIRAMLGKYMGRINHIYIDLDQSLTAENVAWLTEEHPQLQVIQAEGDATQNWFNANGQTVELLAPGQFYIVDPMGWVMMYYTSEHDYKQVNSDMKFLLKNS